MGSALLSFLAVALIDAAFGRDVTLLLTLHDETEREQARKIYDPRDDVAEIYGRVESPSRVRVIVLDDKRLITPSESPMRRLFFVNRAAGETALLARALWWRVAWIAAPLVLIGLLLLARSRRRRPPA